MEQKTKGLIIGLGTITAITIITTSIITTYNINKITKEIDIDHKTKLSKNRYK